MLTQLIHLLGGYTESDMHRKYLEGRYNQAIAAAALHDYNEGLRGAAYKNKMLSEISKQVALAKQEFEDAL